LAAPTDALAGSSSSSSHLAPPPLASLAPPGAFRNEASINVAKQALAPAGLLDEAVINSGEIFQTTLAMLGMAPKRESWPPLHLENKTTSGWRVFPFITEVPCYGHDWDPLGGVWGRPGHAALMVKVGVANLRTGKAEQQTRIKDRKKKMWHASKLQSWPWWIWHESEQGYWLPGVRDSGRGYSGLLA